MSLISLDTAQKMVEKYQYERPTLLAEGLSTDILPLNITLPKQDIGTLIDQDGCTGIRIYFGMQQVEPSENASASADKMIDVVLVAVNGDGDDIIADINPILIDQGTRCPPTCPVNSGLNP